MKTKALSHSITSVVIASLMGLAGISPALANNSGPELDVKTLAEEIGAHGAQMGQGLARIKDSGNPQIPLSDQAKEADKPDTMGAQGEFTTMAGSWMPPGIQGMDVSSHQGNVDWNRAWNQGSRFAYVKATEGTGYKNPNFGQQYNGSNQVGMIRGAYHFALPGISSGADQANYFINNGGGWSADGNTLPPLLDIEYNPYSSLGNTCYNLTQGQMVNWIRDFSNTVKSRTGRAPAIYTTTDWWNTCTGNSSAFAVDHPLHIANYNQVGAGRLPAGWGQYSIWQYSSTGPFVGDSNVWNGSAEALRAFARGSATAPVSPFVSYFKYENDTTIYGRLPDGSFRSLNWAEYSSYGQPSFQTLAPVWFVKNSWESNIYIVGSDYKGKALNFQEWSAYGRPDPTTSQMIPGTYFTTKFDNKLYYVGPAGEVPATDAEWKAAGSPALKLPTRYVKYDWDTTIYRQTATSKTSSTISPINYSQWSTAGFPSPEIISYIPGTTFFKYNNLDTIFMKSPSGAVHPATYAEWKSAPESNQGYSDAGIAQFVKNDWGSDIYLVGSNYKGYALNFQEWDSYGRPAPSTSKLIPGSYFITKSDNKLYYMSPAGEVPATDADWRAAGSPTIRKG